MTKASIVFDRKKMYLYPWYISDLVSTKDIAEVTGGPVVDFVFSFIDNGKMNYGCDELSTEKVGKALFDRLLNEKNFIHEIVNQTEFLSSDLLQFCEKLPNEEKLQTLSINQLLDIYSEYIEKLRALRVWGWVPVYIDGMSVSYLTEYIQASLAKELPAEEKKKLAEYYGVLSSSEKMSEVQQEEYARLQMMEQIEHQVDEDLRMAFETHNDSVITSNYRDVDAKLNKHLSVYDWLTYGYSGPPMTKEYLLKSMNETWKAGSVQEQINSINQFYKEIVEKKKQLISKLGLSESIERLFSASSQLMFIKDFRKGSYLKSYVAMDPIIAEIGKRIQLSQYEMRFVTYDELREAAEQKSEGKLAAKARMRTKKCAYKVEDGAIEVYEGEKCEERIKQYLDSDSKIDGDADIRELRGMTAYGGTVVGEVKIVLVEKDVEKVNSGDILVSSSTNPDLILAMKKAAAFVTDTGGITSHAAIVSRELKKPCVVGTKIATNILRDGDRVEVDADNGIVKKV